MPPFGREYILCEMAEEKVRKYKASGLPRIKVPEQDPRSRSSNFEEVPYGVSLDMAMDEASRCLQCPKPRCSAACPVNIRIPEFITEISHGNPEEALKKLKTQTALPAVCGRVCPHEKQCEGHCVLGIRGDPVAIGTLERFSADYVRMNRLEKLPDVAAPTGKKVAIVGCGPAGITAAADLAIAGHEVHIFEKQDLPGGVLMCGIPEFRLPKEIVLYEVEQIKKLGVKIHLNYKIGRDRTLEQLMKDEGFDAIFIGSGAGQPIPLGIPGEDSEGVMTSNEFLTRYNLMKAYDVLGKVTEPVNAKKIVTIGGGNVAMDASRTALRIGAESTVVYRRAREQMPAREVEIRYAEQENVKFMLMTNPKRIIADENGRVKAVECVKMEFGEVGADGRKSTHEVEGSEFQIPCDAVIIAIGNRPSPIIPNTSAKLRTTAKGTIEVDPETLQTSIPGIFAGGDVVSGAETVINAMGHAKIAARGINKYLSGEPLK